VGCRVRRWIVGGANHVWRDPREVVLRVRRGYAVLHSSCVSLLAGDLRSNVEAMDFGSASKSPFTWDEERDFGVRMDALQSQLATEQQACTGDIAKGATV